MKPATPKTELPPSAQLREAVFVGSYMAKKANVTAEKGSATLGNLSTMSLNI